MVSGLAEPEPILFVTKGVKARSAALVACLVAAFAFLGARGAFAPAAASDSPPASGAHLETAVLAGGCFWGMEGVFESLRGVTNVVSGFSGGSALTAHYEIVSTGMTGHAESVQITYDPQRISYRQLLEVYFTVAHDPTERDRQGPDEGTQYRSAIFYATPEQEHEARDFIAMLTAAKAFPSPIVTEVVPLRAFYPAEAYHQHFMRLHPDYPYIVYNDAPKIVALRKLYPQLVASQ
jgi:peptide-methionine (S)-S-oxide reductase